MRSEIASLGIAGPLLILALTLIHAVVFYPAEIVDAAAGFAYGFFPALALMMVGWLLSGLLCFASAARWRGRCSTAGSASERFERIERDDRARRRPLLLALRLIPIFPFSIVCYAAGAARVPSGASSGRPRSATCRSPRSRSTSAPASKASR